MTPQHLLALCAITCFTAIVDCRITKPYHRPTLHQNTFATEFWWDLTQDHDAPISDLLVPPMSREYIEDRSEGTVESRKLYWQLQWAYGTSIQWLAGGYGFWTAWAWNSTHDQDEITGGGFIYNETELGIVAGVNWMQEGSQGVITWNCFVEGNVKGQLPWSEWELSVDDGLVIGFKKQDWKWGFTKGDIKVVSKHCATGSAVVGKRYKYYKGKEIASSVDTDPFQQTVKPRHKRSPDFFEKVSQTVKEWFQKVKKFFTGGDQQDGGDAEARDVEKLLQ